MGHCRKLLDSIKAPVRYEISTGYLFLDCKGWDIDEIDELMIKYNGTRDCFILKIKLEEICQKEQKN